MAFVWASICTLPFLCAVCYKETACCALLILQAPMGIQIKCRRKGERANYKLLSLTPDSVYEYSDSVYEYSDFNSSDGTTKSNLSSASASSRSTLSKTRPRPHKTLKEG